MPDPVVYPLSYPTAGEVGFHPTRAGALGPQGGAWPPEYATCPIGGGLFLVLAMVTVSASDATIELRASMPGAPFEVAEKRSIGVARGQTVRMQFGALHVRGRPLPPGDVSLTWNASGCSVGAVELVQLGWYDAPGDVDNWRQEIYGRDRRGQR